MKILAILIAAVAVVGAAAVILLASPFYQAAPGQSSSSQLRSADAIPDDDNDLQVRFENATNLTNNAQDSVYGQVAAWDSNVYVVWQDSIPSQRGNYDIFIMKSADEGTEFGQPLNLSNNSGFSEHPQIAAYQDSVYVVWADNTSGSKDVFFTASNDNNGTAFGRALNLSDSPLDSFNQEVAAYGSDVYAVWLEEGEDGYAVMFSASADGGLTFGEAIMVSDLANEETYPKVAAHEGGAYVAWNMIDGERENGLFFAKGSDLQNITKINRYDNFGESQVIAHGNEVHVVSGGLYSLEVNNLLAAKSDNGGQDFTLAEIGANGTFVNPQNVEAATGNSTDMLYVAGQVAVSGNEEILLMLLPPSNEPAGIVNLSKNVGISECPSIAVAGDNIYVVWEDLTPGNHEVLFAKGKMM